MADTLNATVRENLGSRNSRRLRNTSQIPAVLYGHGQESVSLSIPESEILAVIRHGAKLVDVTGAVKDSALIQQVQWDALGSDVLHLDLLRVSKDEAVTITVAVHLRGEAPGTKEGGVLDHARHEIELECRADSIPEPLEITVNELHVGQSITVGQLELPDGVTLLTDPDLVLVQCVEAAVEADDEDEVPGVGGVEPEVIGRKTEEDEGEE
ncbi:MAG: 50S ribosomal protein L25 [Planctomycetaceae bacterium]|nr:50S ribosomal protein L25 [Planctomycetaceae bacterium]